MGTSDPEVRNERLSRLAWSLAAVWLACWLVTVALLIANRSEIHGYAEADAIDVVLPIGFAVMGTLVASRQPRNPIGWILLSLGLLGVISGVVTQYVYRSVHFTALPFAAWVAWLHDPLDWVVFPAGLATFFFLLFPDGHLPSRRWRWLARFAVLVVAVGFVLLLLQSTITIGVGTPTISNPLGSVAAVDMENGAPGLIWLVALAVLLSAIVGVVVRTRRSTGELRQQLRWLAFAAAVTGAAMLALIVGYAVGLAIPDPAFDLVILFGFGVAVPVACGVAVLKHGLYDLDVVISKTVVFGGLAVFITVVYVGVVFGIGQIVGATGTSPALSIVATAVVAVAFQPVRNRVQRFANRLVYGKRATPYEVLSQFSDRIGATYATEELLPRMAQILAAGTGGREAAVWIVDAGRLRMEAIWPADTPRSADAASVEDIAATGVDLAVPVSHQGEVLGALSIIKKAGDPLTPTERKLVDDLAAQGGLVLRNVRLLEDLRESRRRIVTAQDERAKALERNLHDGAQQQLVALAVKQRLAATVVRRDPDRAAEMLEELQTETAAALENLRDLARGIYPPLLADKGLAAALESQARKAAVPTTVESDGIGRYPQEVESAVYFCTLEALNNVAKYAEASRAEISLAQHDGGLTFTVADDGVGFDADTKAHGTGLQGMRDRLDAIGGTLEVRSQPGRGTTVTGRVSVAATEQA